MDLSKATTEDLRAELGRRQDVQRAAEREAIAKQFPCPECGAPPEKIKQEAYEGTGGMRYETTVICENGHVMMKDDVRWFDEPRKGPPMLPTR